MREPLLCTGHFTYKGLSSRHTSTVQLRPWAGPVLVRGARPALQRQPASCTQHPPLKCRHGVRGLGSLQQGFPEEVAFGAVLEGPRGLGFCPSYHPGSPPAPGAQHTPGFGKGPEE